MDKFSVIDNYEMENINGGSWLSIVGSVAAVVLTACPVPAAAACVGYVISGAMIGVDVVKTLTKNTRCGSCW